MKLTLGGADQFELEAEANERRILRMLSGGAAAPLAFTRSASSATRRSPLEAPRAGPMGPLSANAGGNGSVVLAGVRFRVKVRAASAEPAVVQAGPVARRKLQSPAVQVAAKSIGGARSRGADLARSLDQSAGQPLPEHVRRVLEPAFGQSFANVRIHLDQHATMAAAAVSAEAFTLGRDIYFNRGYFDPGSPRGIALIGHELTHVAQNAGSQKVQRSALDDALGFYAAVDGAVARYGGDVSFEDPQKKLSMEYYMNTGSAAFNRAPGGEAATGRIEYWLRSCVQQGVPLTQEDVILQAIVQNQGRVTLAMGSLAEILEKGQNRAWAGRIKGLRNDGKDYYRFAGAYVGLQSNVVVRGAGALGSYANIAGNPLVYTGGGLWDMGKGVLGGDRKLVSKGWDDMAARWKPGPNVAKVYEFNLGMITAEGWREHEEHKGFYEKLEGLERWVSKSIKRKGLTVAGNDAQEQEATHNEAIILRALSRGRPLSKLQASAGGLGGAIRRSPIGGGAQGAEQLAEVLSDRDLARLELEIMGRRFIDYVHYEEEVRKGSATPFLRYGEAEWKAWSAAAAKVSEQAKLGRPLTHEFVKEIHRLAADVGSVYGTPGMYKDRPNMMGGGLGPMSVQPLKPEQFAAVTTNPDLELMILDREKFPGFYQGRAADETMTVVAYSGPEKVEAKMSELFQWVEKALAQGADPVEVAARAQRRFISIHPFLDGNGRTSRLLMDYILERAKLPPALLRDPNLDTMVSEQQWIAEVRKGVQASYDIVKKYTAPALPSKLTERLSAIAQRIFSPVDSLVEVSKKAISERTPQWLKELLFGEEFGLFSKLYPEFKGFIGSLARGLGEAGGIASAFGRIGKFLFGVFGGIMRFAGKIAGPLQVLATIKDFYDWTQGPKTLVEKADGMLKEVLKKGDDKAWDITHFYYAPLVFFDVVSALSFLGALIPPAAPVLLASGLAAGAASLIWSGIGIPFTKYKWGGVGLPLAGMVFRKRRGLSQFADEDPEVEDLYHSVVQRYGREPGVSLDWSTKSRLERFLGRDLGEVRIHSGPLATEVARATEAEALTYGRDIYIPSDKLGSAEGLRLLAHEATHVAQAAPATPTASPRSLGAGAGIEAMEDVARSIEARFVGAARAYPAIVEPVVREAPPVAPVAVPGAAAAPPVEEVAPAALAPAEAVQRRAVEANSGQTPGYDPVAEVLQRISMASAVSQEEFLDLCTERLLELMKDEVELDASRRETLNWNEEHPSV
jgi:hypothetical protein